MKYLNNKWALNKDEHLNEHTIKQIEALRFVKKPEVNLKGYKVFYFDGKNNDLDTFHHLIKTESKVCVLFKRGSIYEGNLIIEGSLGSKEYPLVIGAYGEGPLPKFIGEESVIHILDSHVYLRELEVTGPRALRGIHITPRQKGVMENIVIENCYVHDINWEWDYNEDAFDKHPLDVDIEKVCPEYLEDKVTKFRYHYRYHGGIIAHNEIGPSYFKDVWFVGNVVKNVARTGLTLYNKWTNKPGVGYGYNEWVDEDFASQIETGLGYFGSHNIYCLDNYVECPGGDGIVISSATNVVVRGNTCYFANYLGRLGYWNGSIWVYNVKNCLYELNEAAYTYKYYGSEDAEGFDIDNTCENVLMQYNYAHHNQGGGLLCCNLRTPYTKRNPKTGEPLIDEEGKEIIEKATGKWVNNYIYKNYFYHNGMKEDPSRSAFLTIAREVTNSIFKHNIVVLADDIVNQSVIQTEDKSTYCYDLEFIDNIFYKQGKSGAIFTIDMMYDYRFINNQYFGVENMEEEINTETRIIPSIFNGDITIDKEKDVFKRKQHAQKNLDDFKQFILEGGQ